MLGPSRILGLGGAYAGLAEGVDGVSANVATPGVRAAYSGRHIDYDLTASVSLPGSFASTDFENQGTIDRGSASASNFIYANAGALLQVGPFGTALTLDVTTYNLESPQGKTVNFRLLRAHAIVAWAFLKYQLVVGVGLQGVTMNLASSQFPLAPPSGISPEAGALLRLDNQPWRLGVSARAPVSGGVSGDQVAASGKIPPQSVVAPGQIQIGFALQLGPRPLNPKWEDPSDDLEPLRKRVDQERSERAAADAAELAKMPEGPARKAHERELDRRERAIRRVEDQRVDVEEKRITAAHDARFANWPRPKLLVVADAVITAPVDTAVPVSGFLDQTFREVRKLVDRLAARRPRGRAARRSVQAALRHLPRAVALRVGLGAAALHVRRRPEAILLELFRRPRPHRLADQLRGGPRASVHELGHQLGRLALTRPSAGRCATRGRSR